MMLSEGRKKEVAGAETIASCNEGKGGREDDDGGEGESAAPSASAKFDSFLSTNYSAAESVLLNELARFEIGHFYNTELRKSICTW